MNKNERPSFLRGKGAAVGIVICFVAVIAMVGAYTFNNYQKQIDEQVAKAEDQAEELTEEKSEEAATDDIVLPEEEEEIEETDTDEEEPMETQEQTPVQQWLMAHCAEYGFILRYPTAKTETTGIIYEPWHYRYVGQEAAAEIYQQGVCLEEYIAAKYGA